MSRTAGTGTRGVPLRLNAFPAYSMTGARPNGGLIPFAPTSTASHDCVRVLIQSGYQARGTVSTGIATRGDRPSPATDP
jgi:hypothetical protein